MTLRLTDQSLMSFGKYKGYKLANVPAFYLLWLYDNLQLESDLRRYIEDNKDILQAEVKRSHNLYMKPKK